MKYIKGQLKSEWIFEVIALPKWKNQKLQGFLPYQTNKICVVPFFGEFWVSVGSFFWLRSLFVRAKILVILGLHFGRNDDLMTF